MKRNWFSVLLFTITLLLSICTLTINPVTASNPVEYWALIVCGSTAGTKEKAFANDTAYMYHVMNDHYDFNGIKYLSVYESDPDVDALATNISVRDAITDWLDGNSDSNDRIFIYFSSHGGGCLTVPEFGDPGISQHGGRWDESLDENWEHHEADLGEDIDGDNIQDDWVGVDEFLWIGEYKYWDDDLAYDLDTLDYGIDYEWLVFIRQGCFGGGLIDDLSDEGRIIITASNETCFDWNFRGDDPGDPGYGYNEWSAAFIDALHGEKTWWDETNQEVVHTSENVDADENEDGHISMCEAFNYAKDNDMFFPYRETPWLDDDADGYPTYVRTNGVSEDVFGDDPYSAEYIWFPKKPVASFTVSNTQPEEDEVVDFDASNSYDPDGTIESYHWDFGDGEEDSGVTTEHSYDEKGTYNVTLTVTDDDGLIDPQWRNIYVKEKNGGSGCPYVYTWNGTQFLIDNNILAASEASNGSDVEDYYNLEQTLVPTYQGRWFSRYSLLISEFEHEHSYIDKVRLYAVDHDLNVNVALTSGGQILTYSNPNPPVLAIDNYGYDWLPSLLEADDIYYLGFPEDYLILDFGSLDISQAAKLVLRANLEWKKDTCIHVQVLDETDEWTDASILRTRNNWSTTIVDLTDYLPNPGGTLKIRLYFTGIHKIDYVGLDPTPQADYELHYATLVSATHSVEGNVRWKLLFSDDIYAELIPDQQIELKFILRNNSEEARTFIIYVEGHYETIS